MPPFLKKIASPTFQKIISILIIVATLSLFAYYAHSKPELLHGLSSINVGWVVLLLGLYSIILTTNAFILRWSVELCSKYIGRVETLMLTSYSSLVNFFGPLQSGPGFRALYLKKKSGVSLKSYGIATLLYYGIFGLINAAFLCYALQPVLALGLLLVVLAGAILGAWYMNRRYQKFIKHPAQVAKIIVITLAQVALMVLIYYTELKIVNKNISLSQALIYTGAANLALFVSLTPGALGIRESFLFLSQRLHHINSHTIVKASIIDRAVYFIFLGLLFLLTASSHVKDRLKKPLKESQ